MTKHLVVYVVEKEGYDPIHNCNMTGDFTNAKCLVRRPLGWSTQTTDLDPVNTIERFFGHNMTVTELDAMTSATREIAEAIEAEAENAFERLNTLKRVLVNRMNKIRERSGTAALSRANTSVGVSSADQP